MIKKLFSIFTFSLFAAFALAQEPVNYMHDPGFAAGFAVHGPSMEIDTICGQLLVDSTKTPVWNLRQYNSKFNMASCKYESTFGSRHIFSLPGNGNLNAKVLTVNPAVGAVTLECNASAEYTGIRKADKPWIYMTIDAPTDTIVMGLARSLKLSFAARTVFYEDCMGFLADKSIHGATCRMFLKFRNVNRESSIYGKYFRLGLIVFDNRLMGQPLAEQAVKDNLAEDKLFDYYAASSKYLGGPHNSGRLPKPRQTAEVSADVRQLLGDAIAAAQAADLLGESYIAEWELVGCDYGWEMTGNYNASSEIKELLLTK